MNVGGTVALLARVWSNEVIAGAIVAFLTLLGFYGAQGTKQGWARWTKNIAGGDKSLAELHAAAVTAFRMGSLNGVVAWLDARARAILLKRFVDLVASGSALELALLVALCVAKNLAPDDEGVKLLGAVTLLWGVFLIPFAYILLRALNKHGTPREVNKEKETGTHDDSPNSSDAAITTPIILQAGPQACAATALMVDHAWLVVVTTTWLLRDRVSISTHPGVEFAVERTTNHQNGMYEYGLRRVPTVASA